MAEDKKDGYFYGQGTYEANINPLLKTGDVYCQNCGRVSHCVNAITLVLNPETLPADQVLVCKHCRCDTCKSDIYKREDISKFYAGDGTYIHCPNGKPDRIEDDGTLTYYQK
jgi:deoxycytidylate deaminase